MGACALTVLQHSRPVRGSFVHQSLRFVSSNHYFLQDTSHRAEGDQTPQAIYMSNKPRSQRSSGSAPSEDKTSGSSRRARRKEKQQNAEAGPSSSSTLEHTKDVVEPKRSSKGDGENTFTEADFIPFSFSDPEEPAEPAPAQEDWPPTREWDRGKGKSREKERERGDERESAGRKRKVEEVDFDDGYANKKQRVAAASRRAPWVNNVDWDRCANVAEMYARMCYPLARANLSVVGYRAKWRRSWNTSRQR